MSNENKEDPADRPAGTTEEIDYNVNDQLTFRTPATSMLPRKRHATKSPVPPGSLESASDPTDAASVLDDCQVEEEENSFMNRNLRSAFASINNDNAVGDASLKQAVRGDKAVIESTQQLQLSQMSSDSCKEIIGPTDIVRQPSVEPASSRSSTAPRQQPTPPRIQQKSPQQQQPVGQPQTPVRSKTNKLKRYRQASETLFSPKPINWSSRGSLPTNYLHGDDRPPRPNATVGDDLTKSPETCQDSLPMGNESYNTSNASYTTTGSGYDSSPATPFRFHAFPASLPRVHHKNDMSDGNSFSSTPFRLNESLDASQQMSVGDTRYLRPKPTSSIHGNMQFRQPLPPLSPATRKLFDANRDSNKHSLPTAPSFETVDEGKDTDISGDWSESGMSFSNERMKMATSTTASIPSHVTSHRKMPNDDNEDTDNLMEGDDAGRDPDFDQKLPSKGTSTSAAKVSVNLFYSPPQNSDVQHPQKEENNDQSQSTLETTLHPHTPRTLGSEQFNIHNLEVSPIIRRPEEDGGIVMKNSLDDEEPFKSKTEKGDHHSQQQLFLDDNSPRSDLNLSNENEMNTSIASSSMFSADYATATSASTATVNNTTTISNISSTTRLQNRKIRPMPDTSAFDMSTPGSRDSGATSHKTSSSGLLCPPTPIRTPAWAHAEGRPTFQRSNSLISTKVLAACPPRVLDNLSSLEDSMLENDISGFTMDQDTHPLLSSSFAPVAEKEENDSFENEDLLFTLNDNFDEQLSPMKDTTVATLQPKQDGYAPGSVSFTSDFVNLGILGSGAFADVYKVRSRKDQKYYAIKRTRRQFRGVKDRERAMSEVQTMQRLQADLESLSASAAHDKGHTNSAGDSSNKVSYGLYLLFFIQAWQEDGYFFCQTELCSRATCGQLRNSLTSQWTQDIKKYPSLKCCIEPGEDELKRLLPERVIWQLCHDISRGLFHIHSHGMVHYDIKPSNIFFVSNLRLGTRAVIGDFGLAGDIGAINDGQEGDTAYMPKELLSSCAKHPGADIFSLGVTLYEMAASVSWSVPREGNCWQDLRSGSHIPNIPSSRSDSLLILIQSMIRPNASERPSAKAVSEHVDVKPASALSDSFLSQYVKDVELYDSMREKDIESAEREARRRWAFVTSKMIEYATADLFND